MKAARPPVRMSGPEQRGRRCTATSHSPPGPVSTPVAASPRRRIADCSRSPSCATPRVATTRCSTCAPTTSTAAVRALARLDETVTDALARGQMEVKPAVGTYLRDGAFDPERMLDCLRDEHARALGEGYAGLSLTGDMSWAFSEPVAAKALGDYEARLNGLMPDAKPMVLCLYDHSAGRLGSVSRLLLSTHDIDFPPELAPLASQDQLAAARVMPGGTLRLAGELDFGCCVGPGLGPRRSTSTDRSASTSTASPTWTSPGCARCAGARVSR